ncbi:hypothetical protein ACWCWQ_34730 [Streptomyces sp. NPDC001571]
MIEGWKPNGRRDGRQVYTLPLKIESHGREGTWIVPCDLVNSTDDLRALWDEYGDKPLEALLSVQKKTTGLSSQKTPRKPSGSRTPTNENEHLWALLNADKPFKTSATVAVIFAVSKSAHANGGEAVLSYSRIASLAGCSPKTAERSIGEALKHGWLKRSNYTAKVTRGKSPTGKYRPILPPGR